MPIDSQRVWIHTKGVEMSRLIGALCLIAILSLTIGGLTCGEETEYSESAENPATEELEILNHSGGYEGLSIPFIS